MKKSAHISIRLLKQSDEPFLWEMLYQAIYVPAGYSRPAPSMVKLPDLAKYVQSWGLEHDSGFLAIDANTQQPVIAVWSRLFTGGERGYGYVDDETPELSIAVLPDYRGCGVGTQLLTHLLETIDDKYPAVSLSVHQDNPAFNLYQRLGFEVVTTSQSTIVMKKMLKS